MQHPRNNERRNNDLSCESCGHAFENPIRLTNLSATPMQIYNACPFCFYKLDEELGNLRVSTSKNSNTILEKNEKNASLEPVGCAHYFGYLKKRPKNTPIPEACLTCEKMIKCVL